MFAAYELNQHRKMLNAVRVNKRLNDIDVSEELKLVESALDPLRKHLNDDKWKEHWSGVAGMENVSKLLGADDWYDTVFRFSSGALHASSLMRQLYDAGGEPGIDIAPDAQELPMVLAAGSQLLWQLAKVVCDALGLDATGLDSAQPTVV